ncbi:hypothetical protein VNO77_07747 [Canavalia gladiata]|uniref:Uncharacterized protein n=1 Tax=Canavalia gladiata TaxID=3824 RepID=A0AAN9MBQ4_CANGL
MVISGPREKRHIFGEERPKSWGAGFEYNPRNLLRRNPAICAHCAFTIMAFKFELKTLFVLQIGPKRGNLFPFLCVQIPKADARRRLNLAPSSTIEATRMVSLRCHLGCSRIFISNSLALCDCFEAWPTIYHWDRQAYRIVYRSRFYSNLDSAEVYTTNWNKMGMYLQEQRRLSRVCDLLNFRVLLNSTNSGDSTLHIKQLIDY